MAYSKVLTKTPEHADLAASPVDGYVLTATSSTDTDSPAWEATTSANNATITIGGGTGLVDSPGAFTTNQSSNETITLNVDTGAVSNGATTIPTGDHVYDFVTGLGYSTTSGTVTSVAMGTGFSGSTITSSGTLNLSLDDTTIEWDSGNEEIQAKTAAIADGGAALATADQIHTFVTGFGYTTNTGTTTASNSQTFTNKGGNISQWTNDSGYTTNTGDITAVTITTDTGSSDKASDASGSADFSIVGSTGINVTNLANTISVSTHQDISTGSSPTFADLTLSGNLTVNGNTITTDTETILITNNTLVLNSDNSGTADCGWVVERGSAGNDVSIAWNETKDKWTYGDNGTDDTLHTDSGTYFSDLTMTHVNSSFSNSLTKVPVGHFQWDGSDLYVRTS